jgi:Glycolipid transfer protein (GLTP)
MYVLKLDTFFFHLVIFYSFLIESLSFFSLFNSLDMVQWEMERKVTASVTSKYTSASRSILRLLWFMDFLEVLIGHLLNPTPAYPQLKHMATDAYEKALAPHHPWVVRQTIAAAMYFCPSEEAFWKRIVAETDPHRELDEVKKALGAFLIEMAPVRVKLWAFFKDNKLEDLP